MALPVSVGDAIMLARIAYRLGQAFTSGRKSAPAEFAEVQNLLYTLSSLLELLSRDIPENNASQNASSAGGGEDSVTLQLMLNCRGTLTHLEVLVAKYMEIKPAGDTEERRWKDEIRKNWKKVLWTKEGGDVGKLKLTLIAHINGLNLAVSVSNKVQVESIHSKLDEIHRWFKLNLQDRPALSPPASPDPFDPDAELDLRFAVFTAPVGTTGRKLLCPQVTVHQGWQRLTSPDLEPDLLQCCCQFEPGHHVNRAAKHQQSLKFALIPGRFLVRVIDAISRREWQMYAESAFHNAPVFFYLSDIPPSALARFERHVDMLAMLQASICVTQELDTMAILHSPRETDDGIVSILNLMAPNFGRFSSEIAFASFLANGRRFVPPRVKALHLLHYRLTSKTYLSMSQSDELTDCILVNQPHAELILHCDATDYDTGDDEAQQYIIHINHDTHLSHDGQPRVVAISDCLCIADDRTRDEEDPKWLKCSSASLEFLSAAAARDCLGALQAMRQELFILYLQYPRVGEQTVYQRAIGRYMIRDHYFTNATLTVIFNPLTGKYRLVVLNDCHSLSVCIELPENFLESMAEGAGHIPDTHPAWFVRIGKDGVAIIKQNASLKTLLSRDKVGVAAPKIERAGVDSLSSAS